MNPQPMPVPMPVPAAPVPLAPPPLPPPAPPAKKNPAITPPPAPAPASPPLGRDGASGEVVNRADDPSLPKNEDGFTPGEEIPYEQLMAHLRKVNGGSIPNR